jgi:DNA-binding transcriptional ArsR family regulator
MDTKASLTIFDALSQETRLATMRLLIQVGPVGLQAGEIAERLGIRQNTMSTNLKILAHAGLVTSTRDGRSIIYATNYSAVQALILFLMQDCCGGRPALCQPIFDQLNGCC